MTPAAWERCKAEFLVAFSRKTRYLYSRANRWKTAKLFEYGVEAGAILGGADSDLVRRAAVERVNQ